MKPDAELLRIIDEFATAYERSQAAWRIASESRASLPEPFDVDDVRHNALYNESTKLGRISGAIAYQILVVTLK